MIDTYTLLTNQSESKDTSHDIVQTKTIFRSLQTETLSDTKSIKSDEQKRIDMKFMIKTLQIFNLQVSQDPKKS